MLFLTEFRKIIPASGAICPYLGSVSHTLEDVKDIQNLGVSDNGLYPPHKQLK